MGGKWGGRKNWMGVAEVTSGECYYSHAQNLSFRKQVDIKTTCRQDMVP